MCVYIYAHKEREMLEISYNANMVVSTNHWINAC
jgi:hypothetical protein